MNLELKVNVRSVSQTENWDLGKLSGEWMEMILRDLMADGDITEANVYEDPD